MHQVCYNFRIKGSQPELMSTLGICPFSLLKTSLPALICADGKHFFIPVCHNVTSSAPGRATETKLSRGNATSLVGSPVRRMDSLPPSSTADSSHFPRPHAEHSWGPDQRHLPRAAFGTWRGEGQRGCRGLQHKCGKICTYT